jgi:hypothetical protein
VLSAIRTPLVAALLMAGGRELAAQVVTTLPSPTLPSDTLEANYAPRSGVGPIPERAPTLPGDTLDATQPVDSFPTDPVHRLTPGTRPNGAAAGETRDWIRHHPWLMAPPPVRAVSRRA